MVSAGTRRAALLGLVGAAVAVLGVGQARQQGLEGDWLAYYAAGRAVLAGRADALFQPAVLYHWQAPIIPRPFPWLYPPGYALLFAPLALLPIAVARLAWLGVGIAALVGAFATARRSLGLPIANSVLALLGFLPLLLTLSLGQVSPITLLIFAQVAALEWRGEANVRAGLVASAALYKPQLLVPLLWYWVVNRRGRALLGFAIGGAVVLGISFVASSQATLEYLRHGLEIAEAQRRHLESVGKSSAIAAFVGPWAILAAALVLAALAAVRRCGERRLVQALLWLAPLLTAPFIGAYDLSLGALAVAFLVPLFRGDRVLRAAFVLAWFTPFLWLAGITWGAPAAFAILFAAVAWRALSPRSALAREAATKPERAA